MQSRCFSVLFSTQTHPLTACTLSGKGSGAQTLEIDTGASSPSLGRFPCIRINTVLLGPVPQLGTATQGGREGGGGVLNKPAAAHHSPVRTRLEWRAAKAKYEKGERKEEGPFVTQRGLFFPRTLQLRCPREFYYLGVGSPPHLTFSLRRTEQVVGRSVLGSSTFRSAR